jgi:hypothetical protein
MDVGDQRSLCYPFLDVVPICPRKAAINPPSFLCVLAEVFERSRAKMLWRKRVRASCYCMSRCVGVCVFVCGGGVCMCGGSVCVGVFVCVCGFGCFERARVPAPHNWCSRQYSPLVF